MSLHSSLCMSVPYFNVFFNVFHKKQHKTNSLSVFNLTMRTTSSLEAFNSSLNRSIPKKAHLFKFIECLKLHESRKADRMYSLAHGTLPEIHFKARREKDEIRAEKIRRCTSFLCEKKMSIKEFLEAMATDQTCMYTRYRRE